MKREVGGCFNPSVTKIRMKAPECRWLGVTEMAGSHSSVTARLYSQKVYITLIKVEVTLPNSARLISCAGNNNNIQGLVPICKDIQFQKVDA